MQDNRIAFVVGVSDYKAKSAPKLSRANQDACEIADELEKADFRVKLCYGEETRRDNLVQAFTQFCERIPAQTSLAVLYFSGHGAYIDNEHHLLCLDWTDDPPSWNNRRFTIVISNLQATLSKKATSVLVIVDACRNYATTNDKLKSLETLGLDDSREPIDAYTRAICKAVKTTSPQGTSGKFAICWACGSGNKAWEGSKHGEFTEELLSEAFKPGVGFKTAFDEVKRTLYERQSRQEPSFEGAVHHFTFPLNPSRQAWSIQARSPSVTPGQESDGTWTEPVSTPHGRYIVEWEIGTKELTMVYGSEILPLNTIMSLRGKCNDGTWLTELRADQLPTHRSSVKNDAGFCALSGRGGGWLTSFLGKGDKTERDDPWEIDAPPELLRPCKVIGYQLRTCGWVGSARFQYASFSGMKSQIVNESQSVCTPAKKTPPSVPHTASGT